MSRTIKVFCGGIATETNSFSPIPVGLAAFQGCTYLTRRDDVEVHVHENAVARAVSRRSVDTEIALLPGLYTFAHPGAPVTQSAYETLRDELIADLERAMPVDVVALNLHGAMIARETDDCEGDLLAAVHGLTGPGVRIGALLDPHAHLSREMLDHADVLVCYKENPHTDISERAVDLVDLLIDAALGNTRPVMSVFDCRLADVFQTNREPMKSFVDRIKRLEGRDGILHISIVHGFRRGDVGFMGAKVIVVTDDQPMKGEALAEQLGRELFGFRGRACQQVISLEAAVADAAATREYPFLLADMADNPGGGSPGDSNYILRAMLDRGLDDIAVGYLWDPLGVDFAIQAGQGATYNARIGGKVCPLSGDPIDLDVTVMKTITDARLMVDTTEVAMGDAAYLKSGNLDIVLVSQRHQTYAPGLFLEMGIDLSKKKYIIVKSAQHYRPRFLGVFRRDAVVDAPGVCVADVFKLPLTRIPRPMWPFDEDPFREH